MMEVFLLTKHTYFGLIDERSFTPCRLLDSVITQKNIGITTSGIPSGDSIRVFRVVEVSGSPSEQENMINNCSEGS